MLRGLNKFKFCQKLFLKHPSRELQTALDRIRDDENDEEDP